MERIHKFARGLGKTGYDEIAIQIIPDQKHAIEDWAASAAHLLGA
jgi:hypothetical protein